MNDGIRFSELLAYNEEETHQWKEWFAQNPNVLDLSLDIADAKNVRNLLLHIFFVQAHFAHIFLGLDRVDFQAVQSEIERGPGWMDRIQGGTHARGHFDHSDRSPGMV
jgi:uncharacterized damage-inducible protein DinB